MNWEITFEAERAITLEDLADALPNLFPVTEAALLEKEGRAMVKVSFSEIRAEAEIAITMHSPLRASLSEVGSDRVVDASTWMVAATLQQLFGGEIRDLRRLSLERTTKRAEQFYKQARSDFRLGRRRSDRLEKRLKARREKEYKKVASQVDKALRAGRSKAVAGLVRRSDPKLFSILVCTAARNDQVLCLGQALEGLEYAWVVDQLALLAGSTGFQAGLAFEKLNDAQALAFLKADDRQKIYHAAESWNQREVIEALSKSGWSEI